MMNVQTAGADTGLLRRGFEILTKAIRYRGVQEHPPL